MKRKSVLALRSNRIKFERNCLIRCMSGYDSEVKERFKIYMRRAREKGLCFYLTLNDFAVIGVCHYCGGKSSGYDRIDSSIGYRRDNIVPSCGVCNMMKGVMGYSEFMNHIMDIVEHRSSVLLDTDVRASRIRHKVKNLFGAL